MVPSSSHSFRFAFFSLFQCVSVFHPSSVIRASPWSSFQYSVLLFSHFTGLFLHLFLSAVICGYPRYLCAISDLLHLC